MKLSTHERIDLLRLAIKLQKEEQPANLFQVKYGDSEITDDDLQDLLKMALHSDEWFVDLGKLLNHFDNQSKSVTWAMGTESRTQERRNLIYAKLGTSKSTSELIDQLRPITPLSEMATVVAEYPAFKKWYTKERSSGRSFYWSHYREYLLTQRGMSPDAVLALDEASSEVVSRLADPTAEDVYASRGIVVGYVQSGKTTNFTAVIAKAIDAGYRLIVVLTGMHEGLRRQTQRRLDMELVGKQNITSAGIKFLDDEDPAGQYMLEDAWTNGGFLDFGNVAPNPDIIRLTDYRLDFTKHKSSNFSFVNSADQRPLNHPELLYGQKVRLAVVKKNQAPLKHLLNALKNNKKSALNLPALIIDDESDQASVNTAKIIKKTYTGRSEKDEPELESAEEKTRKKINHLLTSILSELPRGQYVGYTATPFANVFVDYNDDVDIFPKDFLVALPEPLGYMGPSTFFDVSSADSRKNKFTLSPKDAYVRELKAASNDFDAQRVELEEAIATFIVTGAIKMFRQSKNVRYARAFRHHTMLIHEAQQQKKHIDTSELVTQIWSTADWNTDSDCNILQKSFDSLVPTMIDRCDEQEEVPASYSDVAPFINEVINRISGGSAERVVLTVNSDSTDEVNFESGPVWKILVGGAMLSRGFTIEGLTISYFRRAAKAHDTLLQMGRWFGYRPGYQDLVRVYLASNAKISKKESVDLYEAFREITNNEEAFRAQLSIYAAWDGESPGVTPKDIRPLVQQSLPWLKPTAPQKMQNARLSRQRVDVFSPKAISPIPSDLDHNWSLARDLIGLANTEVQLQTVLPKPSNIQFFVGQCSIADLDQFLSKSKWIDSYFEDVIMPKINFYKHGHEQKLIKDFILLFPQLVGSRDDVGQLSVPGIGTRTTVKRTRKNQYYGEFTDERHRRIVESDLLLRNGPNAETLAIEVGQGAILAYIIPETDQNKEKINKFSLGLTIYLPNSAKSAAAGKPLVFYEAGTQAD